MKLKHIETGIICEWLKTDLSRNRVTMFYRPYDIVFVITIAEWSKEYSRID